MADLDKQFDVAIVGAGPAGSSAGIRLADAGLRVLLIEKARFPREKLCGEFISPECLTHFSELGVLDEIAAVHGTPLKRTTFFGRGGNGVTIESSWFGNSGTSALGLSRAQMDMKLLDRAHACGVDVRDGVTATAKCNENGVVTGIDLRGAADPPETINVAVIIDATGRTRALARRFDSAKAKVPARYVAFKTHLRGARVSDGSCEIYAYRGGYGGCNQVEDGLYDLCFIVSAAEAKRLGSDPERIMRECVLSNKRAFDSLSEAVAAKPWLAVPIDSFGRGSLVPADGLITVGDSAAFIDPFTGSGMLLALESARIASAAVIESFRRGFEFHKLSQAYRSNYSSAFDRRLFVCSILRHAAFMPFLAESTIRLLSLSTVLRRRLAQATRPAHAEL